jgi:hypothetical protein
MDSVHQLIGKRPDGEEGFHGEVGEKTVTLGVTSSHQDDHLMVQLEAVRLKLDTAGA